MPKHGLISIIAPAYNEEDVLDLFFTAMERILSSIPYTYEIICVNDGSSDRTLEILLEHHHSDPRIKVVDLSRNFGKELALVAGLDAASGDAAIIIDVDLQDPPEVIHEFLRKWEEGYEIVTGVRVERDTDRLGKRVSAQGFYDTFNRLSRIKIPANGGDFRLLDRKAIDALRSLEERVRFTKGLFSWVGFRQVAVPYRRERRAAGSTKWNAWRLWNFALDGITGFSTLPLRLWSYLGTVVALLGFVYAGFLLLRTMFFGVDVPGYASIMVAVLTLGGLQLISLGILGEYLGRIYEESKRRPLYLIRNRFGFPDGGHVDD